MKPEPPPEAVAIERALTRSRLSVREAAKRAGISEGRWRQIVKGFQSAGGQHIPVVAPKNTLAKMAQTVGLTPAELIEAGRDDAAEVLAYLTEGRGDLAGEDLTPEPTGDDLLATVMRSSLPDAKKRALILMLLDERRESERRLAARAEQMIEMLEENG